MRRLCILLYERHIENAWEVYRPMLTCWECVRSMKAHARRSLDEIHPFQADLIIGDVHKITDYCHNDDSNSSLRCSRYSFKVSKAHFKIWTDLFILLVWYKKNYLLSFGLYGSMNKFPFETCSVIQSCIGYDTI